ncbi:hypothetical protein RN001_013909 [Aquatica leii]|uniref:Uncharacterized protein n=1 Tax=Aquatica leii TaxID=1421715 RepID=A0AAN7PR71_9COLE|nr:hypothetical protein RN001_013909 [Aquatica leii]
MLNSLLFLVVSSIVFVEAGYYWRDYDGIVPKDAIVGGEDSNGDPIYIGQILYIDKLLVAKIYSYDRNAYYTWGIELSSRENIKILCSPYPERFKWVDTTKNGLHLLINAHLIKGGSEPAYTMYIGRAFHKGQTLVGRIRAGSTPNLNLGLYISVPGKEVIVDSFQILTYDANANVSERPEKCSTNLIFKS